MEEWTYSQLLAKHEVVCKKFRSRTAHSKTEKIKKMYSGVRCNRDVDGTIF